MSGQIYPVAFEGQSPEEFGRTAPRIGLLTIPLDSAREQEEYTIGGNILWAISATSMGRLCDIQFQDYTSARLPYGQGQFIGGIPYSKIYVSNEAQPGESITLVYGVEKGMQGFRIDNAMQDSGPVTISGVDAGVVLPVKTNDIYNNIETLPDRLIGTSRTLLLAERTYKREVIIKADPANTDNVRIGDIGISATRGILLQPGQTFVFNTSAEIYAISVSGSQTISSTVNESI